MNKLIHSTLLTGCLLLGIGSPEAQETSAIVQFKNGETADPDDVNSNFNNHEQRLQALEQYQGCTAAQDGSSVVISCADGSAGVLASGGTVVEYSSGTIGVIGEYTYNTGEIVIKDDNGIILGKALEGAGFATIVLNDTPTTTGVLFNLHDVSRIRLTGSDYNYLMFMESDCRGEPFNSYFRPSLANDNMIVDAGDLGYFIKTESSAPEKLLFRSRILSAGERFGSFNEAGTCENGDFITDAYRAVKYTPASEILSAAYPYRLEQLP